jgi:hypothetical protein
MSQRPEGAPSPFTLTYARGGFVGSVRDRVYLEQKAQSVSSVRHARTLEVKGTELLLLSSFSKRYLCQFRIYLEVPFPPSFSNRRFFILASNWRNIFFSLCRFFGCPVRPARVA